MKRVMVLLFLALVLMGCAEKAVIDIPEVDERDKAIALATDAVLASPEYEGGSSLRTTDVIQMHCLGCYEVRLVFDKGGESVPVSVGLANWQVSEIIFRPES